MFLIISLFKLIWFSTVFFPSVIFALFFYLPIIQTYPFSFTFSYLVSILVHHRDVWSMNYIWWLISSVVVVDVYFNVSTLKMFWNLSFLFLCYFLFRISHHLLLYIPNISTSSLVPVFLNLCFTFTSGLCSFLLIATTFVFSYSYLFPVHTLGFCCLCES